MVIFVSSQVGIPTRISNRFGNISPIGFIGMGGVVRWQLGIKIGKGRGIDCNGSPGHSIKRIFSGHIY